MALHCPAHRRRSLLDRILVSPHRFFFCSLLASLVCVYPISLICQHSVSLNVGSHSFHVNIMKATAVHHLLPSEQQQANMSVSKNDKYSGNIPPSQVMEVPVPPKTRGLCFGVLLFQYHDIYRHWNTNKRQHKSLKKRKIKKKTSLFCTCNYFLIFHLCLLLFTNHSSAAQVCGFAGTRSLYRNLMDCVDCAYFITW